MRPDALEDGHGGQKVRYLRFLLFNLLLLRRG